MAVVLTCTASPARRLECRASLIKKHLGCTAPNRARVFWDLDNINARSPEHALVVGSRLKRTVQRLTGVPPALSAYANCRTVEQLRQRGTAPSSWEAVLEVLGAEVVVAGLGKDAADLLMQRDMMQFAQEHGPAAAVVCVSNDQGFAAALDKCGRAGSFTVAVGTYLRSAGFNWSTRPSQLPVPAAANCIVAYHPGRATLNSMAERKLLASWQRRLLDSGEEAALEAAAATPDGALLVAAAATAGTGRSSSPKIWVPAKAHKGVCCTTWLNRERMPAAGQQQAAAGQEAAAAGEQQPAAGAAAAAGCGC